MTHEAIEKEILEASNYLESMGYFGSMTYDEYTDVFRTVRHTVRKTAGGKNWAFSMALDAVMAASSHRAKCHHMTVTMASYGDSISKFYELMEQDV